MTNNDRLIDFYKIATAELISALVDQAAACEHDDLFKRLLAQTLALSAYIHRNSGGDNDSFIRMASDSISLTHHGGANTQ
jgi:hypothetical protein